MSVKNEFAHVERCLEPLSLSNYPEGHNGGERWLARSLVQSGPETVIEQLRLAKTEIDSIAAQRESDGRPFNREPFPRVRIGSDPMTPLKALALMTSPLKYDGARAAEESLKADVIAEQAEKMAEKADQAVKSRAIRNAIFMHPLYTALMVFPAASGSVAGEKTYTELMNEAAAARQESQTAGLKAEFAIDRKENLLAPLKKMVEAMAEVEPASVTQDVLRMFEEQGLKELADTALEVRAKYDPRADAYIAGFEQSASGADRGSAVRALQARVAAPA